MKLLRGTAALAGALAGISMIVPDTAIAQDRHSPLMGAWVVQTMVRDGKATNLPGLFIFTGTHYSMMYVIGDGPRATYQGEQPTDADQLAAYGSFIANSGRYQVTGNQVTFKAFVAKDPNYMSGWPDNDVSWTWRVDGETLVLEQDGSKVTLRLAEGKPAPK